MIDISELKQTKECNRIFIPEQYADALEWQLQQAGVTNFEVIHDRDERSKSIPGRPKLIYELFLTEEEKKRPLTDPWDDPDSVATDQIATVYSHFTENDMIEKIIENIFDSDWFEEKNKRAKEKWIQNFGTEEPCPFE